ncbi:hypothetical protein [Desulfitobacterium chlororespirans]|uniref:Uncharacterized protein n=1 Tax=Desulfitobacterium chlororespirans DSM 11544 TaxID=1121395 RepID=A0A1M7U2W6_9FIRM|nr:hypothetical protein [Desulfitobacterium chlororespirans]SHN77263.1 hypothetical protein SAMN02745215_02863 [Desulfitobacterium chlororespirans DSM 11544]
MTPIELVDSLVAFFKKAAAEYDLATKTGAGKPPQVYAGYLPPKDKGDDSNEFPFIIVRYLEEDDNNEATEVKIGVIIGTYCEDEQTGWRDPLNIATRLKIALKKAEVIGPYSLTRSIKVDLFEDQPFPYWYTTMEVSFYIPQVQIDWSEHHFDY